MILPEGAYRLWDQRCVRLRHLYPASVSACISTSVLQHTMQKSSRCDLYCPGNHSGPGVGIGPMLMIACSVIVSLHVLFALFASACSNQLLYVASVAIQTCGHGTVGLDITWTSTC